MDEKMMKPCPFCGGGTVFFRKGTLETVQCIVCDAAERLRAEAETEERRSRLEAVAMAFIEAGMTIKDLQAVEERRRGRWVPVTNGRGGNECTECGGYAPSCQSGAERLSTYCPTCGALMENGE